MSKGTKTLYGPRCSSRSSARLAPGSATSLERECSLFDYLCRRYSWGVWPKARRNWRPKMALIDKAGIGGHFSERTLSPVQREQFLGIPQAAIQEGGFATQADYAAAKPTKKK